MKKGLALFVTLLVTTFLTGATSWAVGPVMTTPGSTPGTLKPIPLGSVPSTTQVGIADAKTSFLVTDDFSAVVDSVFKDARFTANSCGGTYTERKTVLTMPNLLFREESMGRLEYDLTSKETEQTTFNDGTQRLLAIRVCFRYWRSLVWGGMLANGKFVVVIQMLTDPYAYALIEGRGMEEVKAAPFPVWKTTYQWGDQLADDRFADYVINRPRMEIILTPTVVNGGIGFSTVENRWVIDSENITTPWYLDTLKTKVINYKNSWMETIRMRILVAFSDPAVQSKLAAGITEKFRTKHGVNGPINAITGVIGNGNTITVQHN
jgi:hypothetical protein